MRWDTLRVIVLCHKETGRIEYLGLWDMVLFASWLHPRGKAEAQTGGTLGYLSRGNGSDIGRRP